MWFMKCNAKCIPRAAATAILAAVLLSGCSQVITTALPDLSQSNRPVLSSAEQERAIKEMLEKKNQAAPTEDGAKGGAP
ncbi:MAG TPA: hypothetical protein VNK52_00080 [Hyphomicrobiaceae bacterium]|nr:hypothetical protein [Hyphomicrobiaceae bacterium]